MQKPTTTAPPVPVGRSSVRTGINSLEFKLRYLEQLRHIDDKNNISRSSNTRSRVETVCDSIEKDLGIG